MILLHVACLSAYVTVCWDFSNDIFFNRATLFYACWCIFWLCVLEFYTFFLEI